MPGRRKHIRGGGSSLCLGQVRSVPSAPCANVHPNEMYPIIMKSCLRSWRPTLGRCLWPQRTHALGTPAACSAARPTLHYQQHWSIHPRSVCASAVGDAGTSEREVIVQVTHDFDPAPQGSAFRSESEALAVLFGWATGVANSFQPRSLPKDLALLSQLCASLS